MDNLLAEAISIALEAHWNEYAKPVLSHRPPFSVDGRISGYNLFVSAYHGFAVLGNEHTPAPQPFMTFPIFGLRFVGAIVINNMSLKLLYEMSVEDDFFAEDYAVLGKIQLTVSGGGSNSGKMRNTLASSVTPQENGKYEVEFIINDYVGFCGIDADSYSVHMKYLLIDRKRGYRSNSHRVSAMLSLG